MGGERTRGTVAPICLPRGVVRMLAQRQWALGHSLDLACPSPPLGHWVTFPIWWVVPWAGQGARAIILALPPQ